MLFTFLFVTVALNADYRNEGKLAPGVNKRYATQDFKKTRAAAAAAV